MADQSIPGDNFDLGFVLSRVDLFKTSSTRVSWNIFVSKFLFGYRKKAGLFFFDFFGLIFFLRRSLNFVESISCLNLPLFCYSPKFVEGRRVFKNFFFFKKWVKGFLTSFSFMKELKLGMLPGAILCLNTKKYNEIFISEAINLDIPVVGLFDVSSFGLNFFSYLVPSNYTLENQLFYLRLFLRSYLVGYKAHLLRFFQEICTPSFSPSGARFGGLRQLVWKVKDKVTGHLKKLFRQKHSSDFKSKDKLSISSIRKGREKRDLRISHCYKAAAARGRARKVRLGKNYSFDRRKLYKFKIFLFNPLTSVFKNKFLHKFRPKFDGLKKLQVLFCRPKCIRNCKSVVASWSDAFSRASKFLIVRPVQRRERERPLMYPFLFTQGQSSLGPLFSTVTSEKSSVSLTFMYRAGALRMDPFVRNKSVILGQFLSRCKFLGVFSKNLGFASPSRLGFNFMSNLYCVAPALNRHALDISFRYLLNPCFRVHFRLRRKNFEKYLGTVAPTFFSFSFSKLLFVLLSKKFSFFIKSRFVKEFELKFFDRSIGVRFLGLTISGALRRNKFYFRRFFRGLKLYQVLFNFFRYSRFIVRNRSQACSLGLLSYKGDSWYFLLGFFRVFVLFSKNCNLVFSNILNFMMPKKYSVGRGLAKLARQHRFFLKSVMGGTYGLQSRLINLISFNFGLNRDLRLKSLRQGVTRKFDRGSSFLKLFFSSLGQI